MKHGKGKNIRNKQERNPRDSQQRQKNHVRISMGIHAVNEALKVRPKQVQKIIVREGSENSREIQEILVKVQSQKLKVETVKPQFLEKLGHHNQGIACEIAGKPEATIETLGQGERSTVLVLDGVEDPHNLGAILRSSWLMGVEAILIPSERAVGLTPTVHKVSCGGIEHVPVLEVSNLATSLKLLKERGFWVFGLAAGGRNILGQIKIPEKIVWVLGAEDKGLRTTTQKECDELISIPQHDNAASYNVSVAAGITLYETMRGSIK